MGTWSTGEKTQKEKWRKSDLILTYGTKKNKNRKMTGEEYVHYIYQSTSVSFNLGIKH